MTYDIIIIGAGASGLAAGIAAARNGQNVLILERLDKVGKKILATGNGRCNYTNDYLDASCYRSHSRQLYQPVISAFGTRETLAFFETLGILPKERNGYYYPNSDQAVSVLDVLAMELEALKVPIVTGAEVTCVKTQHQSFLVQAANKQYYSNCVIVAAGGQASPALGSNGSGYRIARQLGHHIIPVVPALVSLYCKEKIFKELAGVRCQADIRLLIDNQEICRDTGELQLTKYGISGIPVFQISRYAAYGLMNKQTVAATIDFLPEMEMSQLYLYLENRARQMPYKTTGQLLIGMLNQKLIGQILRRAGLAATSTCELKKKDIHILACTLKSFKVTIEKTNTFENAQVCAGGVDLKDINMTSLESKKIRGLYFTGEVLDVDGICGGYNLQWAWATGIIAGNHAGRKSLS